MILERFSKKARLRQGENGCPSEMIDFFALWNNPWSEYSQAKWTKVKPADLVLDHPSDSFTTRPMVFDYKGAPFEEPVWVDLLTGRVYAFPKEDMLVHSAGVTFVNVPVYDSPCVLTERAALNLQTLK